MKFSAVKRQLLDDQVESAKGLLTYTGDIERKGELEFNPYLKSEIGHLQKYVDQLSVKPKSPFGLYRRTENEDVSYCLHRKHSKSMSTLSGLMKNINKELYRLKKLKQAEKKLEFLEVFQTQPGQEENPYKLPESSTNIPQLSSPKPKYDPISFHDEEEDTKPEMSRAMEGFLIQQEKERKEKEAKKNEALKPVVSIVPQSIPSIKIEKATEKEEKTPSLSTIKVAKEHPLTTSTDSKYEGSTNASERKPLSFSNLRQSGPSSLSPRFFSSSDPERPYGAYDKGPHPHFVSALGRSSGGATLEGQQTKSDDKSKGFY
jgi:hypothetical protein